tara:strand:- start:3303 stop:3584 length:282 start_codon:yes stop_codon:yes gene_type:complete
MPTNSEERLALSVIIQALKDVSSCESAKAFLTNKDDEWEEHRDLIASITNVNGDWVMNNAVSFMQLSTSEQKKRISEMKKKMNGHPSYSRERL